MKAQVAKTLVFLMFSLVFASKYSFSSGFLCFLFQTKGFPLVFFVLSDSAPRSIPKTKGNQGVLLTEKDLEVRLGVWLADGGIYFREAEFFSETLKIMFFAPEGYGFF